MTDPRIDAAGGPMRLCIVTVTHNSAEVLPGFLSSIAAAAADLAGRVEIRLVAVDNASVDRSVALLRSALVASQVIPSRKNDGYAAGINRAIRAWDADAYLILNPDTRLADGSVDAMLACLQRPGVGLVVPRSVREDREPRRSLRRRPTAMRAWAEVVLTGERAAHVASLGERVGDLGAYSSSHEVDWASGSAMLLSAACAAGTGPWDETFFLYSEETDFCLRARAAGFATYYCAEAEVVHLGGESRVSASLHALLTTNRIRCFRKHHGLLRSASFAAAVVVKQFLRLLKGDPLAAPALRSVFLPHARHPELQRIVREHARRQS